MGARWTVARVLALAPDPGSGRAARALTNPRRWSSLGSNSSLVWGRCQGSAREPYKVTVDLNGPTFRCNCPSRKFPCKHGLALLLLWAANDGVVADLDEMSDFAADWAAQRSQSPRDSAPDPVAQAKRLAERESLMSAGIDDFERWLYDVVRQGLASARRQPYGFWDTAGARLVDAQLPGLADRVRTMGSEVLTRPDWATYLLSGLGRWYLAVRAWRQRETLSEATLADLRTVVGWSRRKEEVLAGERLRDRWLVLGLHQDEDERLLSQRTWLYGEESGETVVLLDFAAAGSALGVSHVLGSVIDGEVALYPGSRPRRAILAGEGTVTSPPTTLPGATSIRVSLDRAAALMAENPWLTRVPMTLHQVTVVPGAVVDEEGATLPLTDELEPWTLLALSGGHRVNLFGEWQGERLHPCSVAVDDRLVAV